LITLEALCCSFFLSFVRDVKKFVVGKNRSKIQIFSIGDKGSVGMVRPFPDMLKYSIS
jgi:hypothetical protein